MAEKSVETTTRVEYPEAYQRARGFWEKNSKPIIYVGSAIILAIAAWFGYQKFIKEPKETKASEMIFPAENIFARMAQTGFNKDSIGLVINGGRTLDNSNVTGVLKVISNYDGTAAANRANYIAGACYLHIKEFDKAIKYLKEFEGRGADQVESKAYVMLGHAYAEQKKTNEALSYYKKAYTADKKNEFFGADALQLAATYAEATGNSKDAIDLFKQLKEEYPTSTYVQSGEVDKYLAKLGVFN